MKQAKDAADQTLPYDLARKFLFDEFIGGSVNEQSPFALFFKRLSSAPCLRCPTETSFLREASKTRSKKRCFPSANSMETSKSSKETLSVLK